MWNFLQRLSGKKTDGGSPAASTALPPLKKLHILTTTATSHGNENEDDSGYTSPGLLEVAAVSELSSPRYSLSSRSATYGNTNSPNTSQLPLGSEMGNNNSDKSVASPRGAMAAHDADLDADGNADDEVDDFLNSVISGKTDVLRKQLAQQKLEAAAAAAAASLAALQNSHGHAATTGSAGDSQRTAMTTRKGSSPASLAASGGGTAAQSVPHRHKYISSAARSLQDYELIAFLGSGTFAEVTLARNKITHEYFAVKKISKQRVKEEGCVERTFTERQLLANLHHPFLVRLYQAFQSQTHLYLVLDFAQGGDLFYVHRQQLWLRSMRRLLVKMQYPYYQSISSTFPLTQAGSNRASPAPPTVSRPPPLLSNPSTDYGQHNQHSHSPVSASSPKLATVSRRSSVNSMSRDGSQQHQVDPGDVTSQIHLTSPRARPTSAVAAGAARDHVEEVTSLLAATPTIGGGCGTGFTTTRTMTGTIIPAGTAQLSSSISLNASLLHPPSNCSHNDADSHESTVDEDEDESEFDLTYVNASIVRPNRMDAQQRHRPPLNSRYYATDTVDEFCIASHGAAVVSPGGVAGPAALSGNEETVQTSSRSLSGPTVQSGVMGAAVSAAVEVDAASSGTPRTTVVTTETQQNHNKNRRYRTSTVDGGENASSATPNTSSTAAAALFGDLSSPFSTKKCHRLRRRGRSTGDSATSDDDEDNSSGGGISFIKDVPHTGASAGGTSTRHRSRQPTMALSTAIPSAALSRLPPSLTTLTAGKQRRHTGGGGGTTAKTTQNTTSSSALGTTAEPSMSLAAVLVDAAAVAGTSNVSQSPEDAKMGESGRLMTSEDSRAGRDGESNVVLQPPPPLMSLGRSQKASLNLDTRTTAPTDTSSREGSSAMTSAIVTATTKHSHRHSHHHRHHHRSFDEKKQQKRKTKSDKSAAEVDVGGEGEDGGEKACGTSTKSSKSKGGASLVGGAGGAAKSKKQTRHADVAATTSSFGDASEMDTPMRSSSSAANMKDTSASATTTCAAVAAGGLRAATGILTTPMASPIGAISAQEVAANAAAAHVDLAAPFRQVGMETSKTIMRELPASKFAPDDSHRFPLRLVAFYAVEVALVLQYLHGEGFLYRDLKPENILMRGDGHVMLTDFGVAKYRKGASIATAAGLMNGGGSNINIINNTKNVKSINSRNNNSASAVGSKEDNSAASATVSGNPAAGEDGKANSFTGTTQYMSPEMLRGLPHDSRTDWWSYGCLLFEWANGRKAFDGANQFSLFRAIVEEDVKVAPEDYRLTALEVHTRVAQLHYRLEELRIEYEEWMARQLRRAGRTPMTAAVIFNRDRRSLDLCLLSPPTAPSMHTGEFPSESRHKNSGTQQQQKHVSWPAQVDDAHALPTLFGPSTPTNADSVVTSAAALSPSEQLLPAVQRNTNSTNGCGGGSPQQCHSCCTSNRSFTGKPTLHIRSPSNVSQNIHLSSNSGGGSGNITNSEAVAALFNDSFASQRGIPTSPGAGGGNDTDLPHCNFCDFNNSFASIAHNSIISLGGTPTNLSLQRTTKEEGSSAAFMSSMSPTTRREQQRRERQRLIKRRRSRLSCLAIDPAARDRFLEDAIQQMEDAQALLKDLTLKLLDRTVETRLSGEAVLEHPFFTCPYVVSQLYYRVHQQRSLSRELRKSAPVGVSLGSCPSFTDLAGSVRDDGLSSTSFSQLQPNAASSPSPTNFSQPLSSSVMLHFSESGYDGIVSLSSTKRPEDWRQLFLERRIRAPYTPRLRTRDDLRYFPAAVTATGLSAAVEQHRRLKQVKEQQKERLRASKAGTLSGTTAINRNVNNTNSSDIGNNMTCTLCTAHNPLSPALQGIADSVMVEATDKAAHTMELLAAGGALVQGREASPAEAEATASGQMTRAQDVAVTENINNARSIVGSTASAQGGMEDGNTMITSSSVADALASSAKSGASPRPPPSPTTPAQKVLLGATVQRASAASVRSPLSPPQKTVDNGEKGVGKIGELSQRHVGIVRPTAGKTTTEDADAALHTQVQEDESGLFSTPTTLPKGNADDASTSATLLAGTDISLLGITPMKAHDDKSGCFTNSLTSASAATPIGVTDSGCGATLASSQMLFDRAATLPQSFVDAALAAAAAAQRKLRQQHQQPFSVAATTASLTPQQGDAASMLCACHASTAPLDGRGRLSLLTGSIGAELELGASAVSTTTVGASGAGMAEGSQAASVPISLSGSAEGKAATAAVTGGTGDDAAGGGTAVIDEAHNSHHTIGSSEAAAELAESGQYNNAVPTAPAAMLSAEVGLEGDMPDVDNGIPSDDDDVGGGGGYYEQDALAEEPHVAEGEEEEDAVDVSSETQTIATAASGSSGPLTHAVSAPLGVDVSFDEYQQHQAANPLTPGRNPFDLSASPPQSHRGSDVASAHGSEDSHATESKVRYGLPAVVPVASLSIASLGVSTALISASGDVISNDVKESNGVLPPDPSNDTVAPAHMTNSPSNVCLSAMTQRPSLVSALLSLKTSVYSSTGKAATSVILTPQDCLSGLGEDRLTNQMSSFSLSHTPQSKYHPQRDQQQQLCSVAAVETDYVMTTTRSTANGTAMSAFTASSSACMTPLAVALDTTTTDVARLALLDLNAANASTTTTEVTNDDAAQESFLEEDVLAATRASHGGDHTAGSSSNLEDFHHSTLEEDNASTADTDELVEVPSLLPLRSASVTSQPGKVASAVATAAEQEEEAGKVFMDVPALVTTTGYTKNAEMSAASVTAKPSAVMKEKDDDGASNSHSDESEAGEGGYETSGDEDDDSSDSDTTSTSSRSSCSTCNLASTANSEDVSEEEQADREARKSTQSSHSHTRSSNEQVRASVPRQQQQSNMPQAHAEDTSDNESDLATTTSPSSSSRINSANSSMSVTTTTSSSAASSSRSLSQLSPMSSDGHRHGDHEHTHPIHREHSLLTPEGRFATVVFAGGPRSSSEGDNTMNSRQTGGLRSPTEGMSMAVHVATAAGVNMMSSGVGGSIKSPPGQYPRRYSGFYTAAAAAGAMGSMAVSFGGSPPLGSPWMSHDTLCETCYFGDPAIAEGMNRPDFFGPLTTLPGVAYRLDEEMSGSSMMGPPLAESDGSPAMLPSQAFSAKNTMGSGSGTSGGGGRLLKAGRDAKSRWVQQQRKRINRELQLQSQGETSPLMDAPPSQPQRQTLSGVSSNVLGDNSAHVSPVQYDGASQQQQSYYSTSSRRRLSAASIGFGGRGDHDEFVGFTFMDRSANVMLQHGRHRRSDGEDDFDPFRALNDVNNNADSESHTNMNNSSNNDGANPGWFGGRPGRGSGFAPHLSASPTHPSGLYAYPSRGSGSGGGGRLASASGNEGEDYEETHLGLPQPSSTSNLSSHHHYGSGGSLGDYGYFGVGSGVDHFQNFSFTSPQILQQYLASTKAGGGRGGGNSGGPGSTSGAGGDGDAPHQQRSHR